MKGFRNRTLRLSRVLGPGTHMFPLLAVTSRFLFEISSMSSKVTPLLSLTCITCRIAFKDVDTHRAHYKTDWHRYNLKRKVAELVPVSAEHFQEKVLSHREAANAQVNNRKVCEACRKHFTSQNSYESHLRSRKHHEKISSFEKKDGDVPSNPTKLSDGADDKLAVEENSEDEVLSEPEPLELTECLFCPHESNSMERSLSHMSKIHGFFIPELEYLVDIKGLLSYLCEKVGVYYACLYCNEKGKTFHSVESAQQHMVDKCHCKLFFEGDYALEYAEYYDYTKSYPNHGEVKSESDSKDELAVSDMNVEITDDLELVLPSGSRIGHRAMRVYYKQHVPSQEQRKSVLVSRLMSQYRALGWKESGKAMSRQRDVTWARKMQSVRDMRLGVKANKLQHHFRQQVIF